MSIEHDIRAAQSPMEALAILARAIDSINARLDAPADPWAGWSEGTREFTAWATQPQVGILQKARENALAAHPQPPVDVAAQVAAIEAMLATETDGDEIQALTAKLRLAKDKGRPFVSPVEEGQRAGITSDGTNGDVQLAPVSPERKEARAEWAFANRLEEYIPLDAQQAADAFAAGGPMWLYLGNRDAVMQLPFAARQWLVRELALDSQADAQEVGRDILKSEESVDKDVTLQAIDAMSGA